MAAFKLRTSADSRKQVEMRAVYTMLEEAVPADIAAWSGGTRALLLGLHVGDLVVAGLRLFADHFYFVSEKDLVNLGLEEVALVA